MWPRLVTYQGECHDRPRHLWRQQRDAQQPGLVLQAVRPRLHEALLPAASSGLGLQRLAHHPGSAKAACNQRDDPSGPNLLLRAVPTSLSDEPLTSGSIYQLHGRRRPASHM